MVDVEQMADIEVSRLGVTSEMVGFNYTIITYMKIKTWIARSHAQCDDLSNG
jgi:hypothetical protein